ncbi:KGK domain-containing protein [Argonema galeatum]|uniref:KGK domain-containing protein n=1 Tax=Argonema galeatum TaxID=2942762 RepID=UPI002013867F|nr:KGK domain-containing protein [Argonema galeatum]MCL1465424.1 hypothetical protein [Argonema galeatum A003/A1]
MEFNCYLQKVEDDDVLSFENTLLKWAQFKDLIKGALEPSRSNYSKVARAIDEDFNSQAVKIYPGGLIVPNSSIGCEILRVGSPGWQKGKIQLKITLEFIPDEPEIEEPVATSQPESPLDDLRRMINEDI